MVPQGASGDVLVDEEQPSRSRDVLAELAERLAQGREQMFSSLRESPQDRERLLNRTDHLIHDLKCAGIGARWAYANMDDVLSKYEGLNAGSTKMSDEARQGVIVDAILSQSRYADTFHLGCKYKLSAWGTRTPLYGGTGSVRDARFEGMYTAEILEVMGVLPSSVTADNVWSHINKARAGITRRGPGDPWSGPERGIEVISRMSEDGKHHIGDIAIITAPDLGLRVYVPLRYDGRTGACIAESGGFGLQLTKDRFAELSLNPEGKREFIPVPPRVTHYEPR